MNHAIHLFENTLREAYFVESQLVSVLTQLRDSSIDKNIKAVFNSHLKETKDQRARLEKIFKIQGIRIQGRPSNALAGLIEDRRAFLREDVSPETVEFFNLGAAIKTERIEMSLYETLMLLAKELDVREAIPLIKKSLREEKLAEKKVHRLAKKYPLDTLYVVS